MKKRFNVAGCSLLLFLSLFISILLPWSLLHAWTLRPWTPSSRSPADGALNISTTPTFSWSDGYSSYMVCLTKDPSLTAGYIPCIGSAEGTSYTVPESMRLETNTTYYWEISAWRSGNTYDSSVWSFTTCSPLSITIDTNPSGFQIKVDGASYTAPHTFSWEAGTTHSVEALSPQSIGSETLYGFSSWSDAGNQIRNITIPASNTTYTANYNQLSKYSLSISFNPAGTGTISTDPAGVYSVNSPDIRWYDPGQNVTLSASAYAEYMFNSWSGALSGTANPASIVMNEPKSVTANYTGPLAEWVNIGLTGNSIFALAIDPQSPSILYAGTDGGVYKSTDAGSTWNALNNGLTNTKVRALAIDPLAPNTVYAGTWGGFVFKSIDGGATWQSKDNVFVSGVSSKISRNVLDILINPQNTNVLYSAVYSGGAGGGIGGVFESTDQGATWNLVLENDGRALAINLQDTNTLYEGAWSSGLFKTINGGINWTGINSGLLRLNAQQNSLISDPQTPSTLYAGIYYNDVSGGGGVYKSADSGATWNCVLPNQTMGPLAIHPLNPSTLYAAILGQGVFRSTDNGVTWRLMNNGLTDTGINKLLVDPHPPHSLYAGTGNGVFKNQAVQDIIHPADTNHDFHISLDEATAYGEAWKTGQIWPKPPNPIPIEYVTNAALLLKMGEVYHYDVTKDPPWVPGY